jgi:hypothetical protein
MAAVRARLDAKTARGAPRRKLRLRAQGAARSQAAEVLILDVSTTGLLLETGGDLSEGETIELDIPEADGTRAVVKWTSGRLFGCEFSRPISSAAVSAALLRAPHDATDKPVAEARVGPAAAQARAQPAIAPALSPAARLWWIIALAILSWVIVGAAVSIAWHYAF